MSEEPAKRCMTQPEKAAASARPIAAAVSGERSRPKSPITRRLRGARRLQVKNEPLYPRHLLPQPNRGGEEVKAQGAQDQVDELLGVPGQVAAYGDPWGANPSLVYARTEERRTRMRYQRQGDITTYEWAIGVYDSFPDRPTALIAGKRIGFDVPMR